MNDVIDSVKKRELIKSLLTKNESGKVILDLDLFDVDLNALGVDLVRFRVGDCRANIMQSYHANRGYIAQFKHESKTILNTSEDFDDMVLEFCFGGGGQSKDPVVVGHISELDESDPIKELDVEYDGVNIL